MTILITQNSLGPTSHNFNNSLLEAIFCLVLKREIIIDILSEALKASFLCPSLVNEDRDKPLFAKFSCPAGLESLLSLQPILNASLYFAAHSRSFWAPVPYRSIGRIYRLELKPQ